MTPEELLWSGTSIDQIRAYSVPEWIPIDKGGHQVHLSLERIHVITDGEMGYNDFRNRDLGGFTAEG